MKRTLVSVVLATTVMFSLASCGDDNNDAKNQTNNEPKTLKVITHDSFAMSDALIKKFETDNNVKIAKTSQGDVGEALNKAILTKSNPSGDVFFGVDNTYMTRALDAGIFESYKSTRLNDIPAEYKLDSTNALTPTDHGEVCVDYDKTWFAKKNLAAPTSFADLLKPEYKNLMVTPGADTSSTGLAFLFGTIAAMPAPATPAAPNSTSTMDWKTYWQKLKANGLSVVGGWDQAYNTSFSGTGKGDRPIVVSYSSSPPAAVVDAKGTKPNESPVGVIPSTCFQQVEFVGVLKGTKNAQLAQRFVDFMVSRPVQEDIPTSMYMYPVVQDAQLSEDWAKYSVAIPSPLKLDPKQIATSRDSWIKDWSEIAHK